MTMIPGAWEPRRRIRSSGESAGVAIELAPKAPGRADAGVGVPRRELPGWLALSIFAATLLAATWLAMFLAARSN